MVMHRHFSKGEPYKMSDTVTLNSDQQNAVVRKTVQAFMQSVGVLKDDRVIQAFSGSSDLPQLTKDVFNVTQAVPEFDTLWQPSFRGVPLRRGQLDWEIADVSAGMTFELIPEGGKVKIYGITGSKVSVGINKYGMGIGITWEMVEGRKLYKFVDLMMQVRARLNNLWANTHYGLLATAALSAAVAWSGAATDPIVERDIATINTGYLTIGAAVKDKGYGDVANVPMLLYASPLLKARIMQAFRATSSDIVSGRVAFATGSTAGQVIEYNVVPYFTYNSNIPANKAVLVLPGQKIQNSVYLQELGLSEQDIQTLSDIRTYWTAYGAVVADTDQTAELAFA